MFIRSDPPCGIFLAVSEKHTHFSSGINQAQCWLSVLLSLQVLAYLSLKLTHVSIRKAEHEGHICDSPGASVTSLLPSICQSFCLFLCMTSRGRPVPWQRLSSPPPHKIIPINLVLWQPLKSRSLSLLISSWSLLNQSMLITLALWIQSVLICNVFSTAGRHTPLFRMCRHGTHCHPTCHGTFQTSARRLQVNPGNRSIA